MMCVPDGDICKKIFHITYAVKARARVCVRVCVRARVCASLLTNATQLLHLYLYKTNSVHKFCITHHEAYLIS